MRFSLTFCVVLALTSRSFGQEGDLLFPVGGLFTPSSPASVIIPPSALFVLKSGNAGCVGQAASDFGLALSDVIDGASSGDDVLSLDGLNPPAVGLRSMGVEFSIDDNTTMIPAATTASSNDLVAVGLVDNVPYGPVILQPNLGVSALDNINALVWRPNVAFGPMFFTLTPQSAALRNASGADIFVAAGSGALPVVSAVTLGLNAADDIDALAVDLRSRLVVFSLTPSSAASHGYSGADLLIHELGMPGSMIWIPGSGLGVSSGGSLANVNAVRVWDPLRFPYGPGNLLKNPGLPHTTNQVVAPINFGTSTTSRNWADYALLTINEDFGGRGRRVLGSMHSSWSVKLEGVTQPESLWFLSMRFGRPGSEEAIIDPLFGSYWVFGATPLDVFASSTDISCPLPLQGALPWSRSFPALNTPYTITLQALMVVEGKIGTTNAVTYDAVNPSLQ